MTTVINENKVFYSHELTNEDYHANPAIGSSGLKSFKECPAIYYDKYLAPDREPTEESKAMRLGSFAHIKLLEPERFKKEYWISPEFAVVNKGKKNEALKPMNRAHGDWGVFEEECAALGKKPILHSEYDEITAMALAISKHPLASRMLMNGQEEMSFFTQDPESGLMMKSRPDYLVKLPDYGVCLIDYKTTAISMTTTKQSNHAYGLGRHIQAAHHKTVAELATGGQIDNVVYITQMVKRPYLLRFFRMPTHSLQRGMDERRTYLDGIAECIQKNHWPEYSSEIEDYVEPGYLDYEFN